MMLEKHEIFNLIDDGYDYKTVGIDVQYKIKLINEVVYLLFQESMSKQDWKTNFDFPIKCYKNQENKIYGHRGFIKAYKSCNDVIQNELKQFMDNNKNKYHKVVIAGWSFGGAMAQLASEDFYYRYKIKPTLITFGSPKILFIGMKHFINCCKDDSEQIAYRNDLVPLVPPIYFTFKKKKVGKLSLKELWRVKSHCIYGKEEIYGF